MFHTIREFNKISLKDYIEIYLKFIFVILEKRNNNKYIVMQKKIRKCNGL